MTEIDTSPLPWPATGYSLPGVFYANPDIYERERRSVFESDWFFVAPASDVPNPGDYVSLSIIGEPLMLTRGQDKVVRVISRVCRHRSMIIVEGRGTASSITCPYHSWTYRTDGRLIGAPLMHGDPSFKKEECALPSLAVEIWNGLIFASFTNSPAPLAPQLAELGARFEQFKLPEWGANMIYDEEIRANWKIVLENATESYHHLGAHKRTLERVTPASRVRMGASAERYSTHHNWPTDLDPQAPPAGTKTVGDLTLSAVEALVGGVTTIFPNVVIAVGEKGALVAGVFPIDHQRTNFRLWAMRHPTMATERYEARSGATDPLQFIFDFNEEDLAIAAGVNQGVRSRFSRAGYLHPLEAGLTRFYEFLKKRMSAGTN